MVEAQQIFGCFHGRKRPISATLLAPDLPVSEFGSDFWPGTTNPCGSQGLAQGSYAAFSALTIHT
jgi:hypothetical protein